MRGRTRKVLILAFAAASLAAIALTIYVSLDSQYYFFYSVEARSNWAYDASSVALVCGLIFVEGLVACAAFVAPRPRVLAVRCLLGLLLFVPWAYISALSSMHAPGYIMYHIFWVWLLTLALVVGCFGSGIWWLLSLVRKEPPNNSIQRTQTRYAGSRR
jgi:hypothetical protein